MTNPSDHERRLLDTLWDAMVTGDETAGQSGDAALIARLDRLTREVFDEPSPEFAELLRSQLAERKEPPAMITGIHHLVLFCADAEASREWYSRAGFDYNRGYGGMHWFNAGPYEIMLHPSSQGPAGNVPHIHVATNDVEAMFDHAISQGLTPMDHQQPDVEIDGPVNRPWGDREFELEDPDGHRIVITQS